MKMIGRFFVREFFYKTCATMGGNFYNLSYRSRVLK